MTYERQIATAKRLIDAKGGTVIWRQLVNAQSVDPEKPWKPANNSGTDEIVKMAFFPENKVGQEAIKFYSGTDVPTGCLYALMASQTFEPNLNDVVLRGGELLNVKKMEPLNVNGEIILYEVWLRK